MPDNVVARDVMVTVNRLVRLRPDMDVFEAIGLLLKHRVSGAPVVDQDGNFIGVFSEKDCLSFLVKGVYEQLPSTQLYAFVSKEVCTIEEDTDLLTIAQIFLNKPFRRLPVLRDGKLVGQISRRDVLQAAHNFTAVAPDHENALLYISSLVERNEAPIA